MIENNVAILGKDEKTHTLLGMPAATKQSLIVKVPGIPCPSF